MFLQKTIKGRSRVEGIGLHTGKPCAVTFIPAPPNSGVHFIKKDLHGRPSIHAVVEHVKSTGYATTLGNEAFSVSTVEHCLSALSALRIDNVFIELEGPEIPIVDGSALPFLNALNKVGFVELDQPRLYCQITKPVRYEFDGKSASVEPYHGLRFTITIDFPHPSIGEQSLDIEINEITFAQQIASARTFGFLSEVKKLQSQGLALGGSLSNAVGLDEKGILNPEGLRFPDEFVRHKALDALGDLVTLGFPLLGHVTLYKVGHHVMNQLVHSILENKNCYKLAELGAGIGSQL